MGPPAAEIAADVRSFLAELERDDTLVPSASNGSLPSPTANRLSLSRAAYSHGALLGGNDPQKLRKADMKRIENLARPRRGPGSAHYTPGEVKPLVKGRHGPSKAWLEQRAQPRKTRTRDDNDYEPAIYLHDRGAWSQPCGGKFNESRPKSWIDWNIYLSRSIPGPATYAPHLAPNLPKGGKFNAARTPSALDMAIMRARDLPGPVSASGQIPSTLGTSGVGKINMKRGKTHIDWEIIRARDLPGPGEYSRPMPPTSGGGVRFGSHNPKSELDRIIYNAREIPGPSEYYPERSYLGRRL